MAEAVEEGVLLDVADGVTPAARLAVGEAVVLHVDSGVPLSEGEELRVRAGVRVRLVLAVPVALVEGVAVLLEEVVGAAVIDAVELLEAVVDDEAPSLSEDVAVCDAGDVIVEVVLADPDSDAVADAVRVREGVAGAVRVGVVVRRHSLLVEEGVLLGVEEGEDDDDSLVDELDERDGVRKLVPVPDGDIEEVKAADTDEVAAAESRRRAAR